MVDHRRTSRLAVDGRTACGATRALVVIRHSALVLPMATHVDVAAAVVIVVWGDVDVLGAIPDPVAPAPLPISAAPVPGSIDPNVAVARRCGLLLIERLRRHALHGVSLPSSNGNITGRLDAGSLRLHRTAGGKSKSGPQCQRQWGEGQSSFGHSEAFSNSYWDKTDEVPRDSQHS